MPTLRYFPPRGQPILYNVHKPITSIGRSPGNDVVVEGDGVVDSHAQIIFDGRGFNLEEMDRAAEILVNGKKKRRARINHNDRLTLGTAELVFSLLGDPSFCQFEQLEEGPIDVAGIQQLNMFSERLMRKGTVDELLADMLEAVVEISGAHLGAVLLVEPSDPDDSELRVSVRAARNVRAEVMTDSTGGISDSIVRKVISTGKPVIVSDALTDQSFGKSKSVLALKLSSVMCVPMMVQGEPLGALYVGNDHVKQLFDRSQLDVLTVFAAQASLILRNAMLLSSLRADKRKLQDELADRRFG